MDEMICFASAQILLSVQGLSQQQWVYRGLYNKYLIQSSFLKYKIQILHLLPPLELLPMPLLIIIIPPFVVIDLESDLVLYPSPNSYP